MKGERMKAPKGEKMHEPKMHEPKGMKGAVKAPEAPKAPKAPGLGKKPMFQTGSSAKKLGGYGL